MSGKEKYQKNYEDIVSAMKKFGNEVFEETIQPSKKYVYEEIGDDEKVAYYKKVLGWMNQADVVVVEATHSSLSIGHELTVALEKGKPVIVLYSEGEAPHFLVGVKSDKLQVMKYSLSTLEKVLKDSMAYATENIDTRFNFFISPKISNYLDWVAKKKRMPRAVYLRKLLEEAMDQAEFEK